MPKGESVKLKQEKAVYTSRFDFKSIECRAGKSQLITMYLFYLSYNMIKDANMLVKNAKFSVRSLTFIRQEW